MQDFSLARRAMVDSQLRPQGVTDRGVLAAMGRVERERFVPENARALAYFDRSVNLGDGRSMMSPAALGRLLSEAKPRAGQKALVIGSATGYSAAVLSAIGLDVIALEADEALSSSPAAEGVGTIVGELAKGWPKAAPYDLILIDGAAEEIPAELARQLAPEGVLAGAVIDRGIARLVIGAAANGALGLRSIADSDVGPLPGFERPRAFTF